MIDPGKGLLHRLDHRRRRQHRPAHHDHRQAERTRCGNLAVGRAPAAVLAHENLDSVLLQERALIGFQKRPARVDVRNPRCGKRRIDRVDAAHEVLVLWRAAERLELLATEREKYAARRGAQRAHRLAHIANLGPVVTADLRPRRSTQGQEGNPRLRNGADGIRGNICRIRVGRIDQRIHALQQQIIGKSIGASESSDPHGNRLCGRGDRPTGKRQDCGNIGASGEALGQLPRFRRAAENEDASHVPG